MAPFRLLVLGDGVDGLPAVDGLAYTADPAQAYGGVALVGPVTPEALGRALAVRGQYMAPLMDFAAALPGRADHVAPAPTPQALRAGLAAFVPVIRRLEELPDFGASPDLHGLAVLGLAYSRAKAVEAAWTPRIPQGVDYPLLVGVPGAREVLAQLGEAELLRPRYFDRTYLCGRCESARMVARETCTACHSSSLVEEALVHHYECGHQGPEHAFRERDYMCPKCNRPLNHFGVDYDKPGSVMVCQSCGAANDEPEVRFACLDCGHETPADGAAVRDWFHYELTEEGAQAARAGALPRVGFERLLEAYRQARPLHQFVTLVEHDLDTARRYARPFTAAVMTVANAADLRQTLGQREIGRIFAVLVERVVEILRETDLVAAQGDAIVMAMPETAPEASEIALDRMRQRIAETIDAELRLDVQVIDRDQVAERLGALRGKA